MVSPASSSRASGTCSSATTASGPRWPAGSPLDRSPISVRVVDYGIRGMHLAYDLLDGYDALVLIDAIPGHWAAGELRVLEVGADDLARGAFDAHGMDPVAVLAHLAALGGSAAAHVRGRLSTGRDLEEAIGLSPQVRDAVDPVIAEVRALLVELLASNPAGVS